MVTIGEYTSFCKGVLWRENHNASLQKKKYALVLREKRTKLVKRTQQIVTQNTDVHTVKPSKIKDQEKRPSV